MHSSVMPIVSRYLRALAHVAVLILVLSALHFPLDTDAPLSDAEIGALQRYYTHAYKEPGADNTPEEYDTKYLETAKKAAHGSRVVELVTDFVWRFNLRDRPVLEVGSGRGYLQDIANDYVGVDISPSVARFYHKKFVLGSATALPFADSSFDGAWSIWVFEHVPNPEQALKELRRVVKHNGVIFLMPGWNSPTWAAQGYQVRPYADFDFASKIVKASVLLRSSDFFQALTLLPIRAVRSLAAATGPTTLRYRRLTPNYDQYWINDSDAVNSTDSHEGLLWFLSRGDECLNCDGPLMFVPYGNTYFVIRVRKRL